MPRKKTHHKKYLKLFILLLIFLTISLVVYFFLFKNINPIPKKSETTQDISQNVNTPPEETQKTSQEIDKKPPEKTPTPKYEGEDPNKSETITGVITYSEINSNILTIRLNLDQYLSSGSCDFTLYNSNNTSIFQTSAPISSSASTSTCTGFDINVSNFTSDSYYYKILISADNKTGELISEKFNL